MIYVRSYVSAAVLVLVHEPADHMHIQVCRSGNQAKVVAIYTYVEVNLRIILIA